MNKEGKNTMTMKDEDVKIEKKIEQGIKKKKKRGMTRTR